MKKQAVSLLLGLAFLGGLAPAQAQDDPLKAYLETIRTENDLPALAAAVVLNGQVIAAAATGTRVAGQDIPVQLDDRFHIGSDTKAMTATLAGMLVEDGTLSWTSTVGEVLSEAVPDMSPELAAVTLEQLLSHSSGIPSDTEELVDLYFSDATFDYNLTEQRRRLLDTWKQNVPVVPEGSPFQYSNMGYLIAGMMIETSAGTPWEVLIHERLFTPLGLDSAGLGPQTTIGVMDAPASHRILADGSVLPILWGPAADVPPVIGPAGNAHMSITDFAIWAGWNAGEGTRGPDLVTPETLEYIHDAHVQTPHRENPPPGTPGDGGYGLGWGLVQFDWADRELLTHNGSNSMNLAKILVDPQADLGVVVTTNLPGRTADAATGQVMAELYQQYLPAE